MNAKATSPPAGKEAGANLSAAPAGAVQLMANLDTVCKQQLEVLNECCCALLEGSEGMRKVQLEAAHEALLRHRACTGELHGCSTVSGALQASHEAASADLEAASRYWTDLSRICNSTLTRMAVAPVVGLAGGDGGDGGGGGGGGGARPLLNPMTALTQPFGAWNPLADWVALNAPPLP